MEIDEMFDYSKKRNNLFGVQNYETPKTYFPTILIKKQEKKQMTNLKQKNNKNNFILKSHILNDDLIKYSKEIPGPNYYQKPIKWSSSPLKNSKNLNLSKIIQNKKKKHHSNEKIEFKNNNKSPGPGPGSYNILKTEDIKENEKQKIKKIETIIKNSLINNSFEKNTYLNNEKYLSTLSPGPGAYFLKKEKIKNLPIIKKKKKHVKKQQNILDNRNYDPLPNNIKTFALYGKNMNKKFIKKNKSFEERNKSFSFKKRAGSSKVFSHSRSIFPEDKKNYSPTPGPSTYNLLINWFSKERIKKNLNNKSSIIYVKRKRNWIEAINKGFDILRNNKFI